MDLLHQRYASPFSLLDYLICTKQFSEWVEQFLNKVNKEKNDRKLWEFYLHKVHDKSFDDWKKSLEVKPGKNDDVMDEAEKQKIVEKSTSILNGFQPTKGGGYRNE